MPENSTSGDPYRVSADEERQFAIRFPDGEWVERDLGQIDVKLVTLDGEEYSFVVIGDGPSAGLYQDTYCQKSEYSLVRNGVYVRSAASLLDAKLKAWAAAGICKLSDDVIVPWARVKKFETVTSRRACRWYVLPPKTVSTAGRFVCGK